MFSLLYRKKIIAEYARTILKRNIDLSEILFYISQRDRINDIFNSMIDSYRSSRSEGACSLSVCVCLPFNFKLFVTLFIWMFCYDSSLKRVFKNNIYLYIKKSEKPNLKLIFISIEHFVDGFSSKLMSIYFVTWSNYNVSNYDRVFTRIPLTGPPSPLDNTCRPWKSPYTPIQIGRHTPSNASLFMCRAVKTWSLKYLQVLRWWKNISNLG